MPLVYDGRKTPDRHIRVRSNTRQILDYTIEDPTVPNLKMCRQVWKPDTKLTRSPNCFASFT
jgi:hypothetical protein